MAYKQKGWTPFTQTGLRVPSEEAQDYSYKTKKEPLFYKRYPGERTDAKKVWDNYLLRPDIEARQLDIDNADSYEPPISPLTPDVWEDDCNQAQSVEVGGHDGWSDSSLSKIYSKNSTEVMDSLVAAGRLIIV